MRGFPTALKGSVILGLFWSFFSCDVFNSTDKKSIHGFENIESSDPLVFEIVHENIIGDESIFLKVTNNGSKKLNLDLYQFSVTVTEVKDKKGVLLEGGKVSASGGPKVSIVGNYSTQKSGCLFQVAALVDNHPRKLMPKESAKIDCLNLKLPDNAAQATIKCVLQDTNKKSVEEKHIHWRRGLRIFIDPNVEELKNNNLKVKLEIADLSSLPVDSANFRYLYEIHSRTDPIYTREYTAKEFLNQGKQEGSNTVVEITSPTTNSDKRKRKNLWVYLTIKDQAGKTLGKARKSMKNLEESK